MHGAGYVGAIVGQVGRVRVRAARAIVGQMGQVRRVGGLRRLGGLGGLGRIFFWGLVGN